MRRLHDTPRGSSITSIDDLRSLLRADGDDAGAAAVPANRRRLSLTGILGLGMVAVLISVLVWSVLRADDAESFLAGGGAGCAEAEVRVTTTADFAPVVEAAMGRIETATDPCSRYDVMVASSAAAAAAIGAGTDAPHVWIPDSAFWLDRANLGGEGPTLEAGPVLASTPVVLAAPGSLAQPAGATDSSAPQPWQDILGGPLEPRIDDPASSTASLLVLASATEALRGTPEGEQLLLASSVRMSRETAGERVLFAQASDDTEGAGAVPATEQQIFQQRADDPASPLSAVLPGEPMGALSYSWVVVPDEQQDVATREAVALLGRSLTGVAGVADRQAAGFRAADGSEAPGVPGVPDATAVSTDRTLSEAESVLADWEAAQRDVRLLTVVDDSIATTEPDGDRLRTELVTDGLTTALDVVPPTSQMGLWSFSPGRVGGNAWTELAPIAPLGDGSAMLDAAAFSSTGNEDGGGLYDTVRAAYRTVQAGYQPGAVNAVVLVTDGREDDDEGLTLYQLLAELQASNDPERPVSIFMIGVGGDVYDHELRLISELTGGRHYLAADPAGITDHLVDALTRHFRAE